MVINTTRFGEIEVSDNSILYMPDGMLGLESCKRYILLGDRSDMPFKWLQGVDDPSLAFIVVNPTEFFSDYDVELSDDDAEALGIKDPADVALVTTVNVDSDAGRVTTNLLGPVVINSNNLRAKQVVLQDDRYGTKHIIGQGAIADTTPEVARAA